jgi:hypothetical protein
MGEAKQKEEASKVVKTVQFNEQEIFFLLQACNGRIPTKEHSERRKLDRAFEMLDLDAFEDAIQIKIKKAGSDGLNIRRDLDTTGKNYDLDMATVEFLKDKLQPLAIESSGLMSRMIGRITERLIQVADGRYELPS